MRNRIAGVLAVAGLLTLVTNRAPAATIACFVGAALLGARAPGTMERRLAGVAAFWVLSFLLTTESLRVLASYEFQRRDGQIFFSMLPLAAFAWGDVTPGGMKRALGAFCGVQAAAAMVACTADAAGARGALEGFLFLRDAGAKLNYCALYGAHNAAGSVQALCCATAAAMAAFEVGHAKRWSWGLLTIPLLWGTILSESRGSMMALAVAMAALALLAVRRKALTKRALAGACLAAAATAALFGGSLMRRFGELSEDSGTHTARWEWWERGIREWSWSPLVGEGLGRFNDADREWSGVKHLWYMATRAKAVNSAGHAHNSYVHFLAEGGILGFGVTVGFWAWVAWKLRQAAGPLRAAAFLGVVFLLVISLTEHYMGGGVMLLTLSSITGAAWKPAGKT